MNRFEGTRRFHLIYMKFKTELVRRETFYSTVPRHLQRNKRESTLKCFLDYIPPTSPLQILKHLDVIGLLRFYQMSDPKMVKTSVFRCRYLSTF